MNDYKNSDEAVKVKKALTEDLSSLGPDVTDKLRTARYAAITAYERDRQGNTDSLKQAFIPSLIFASAFFVVAGIWLVQPSGQADRSLYRDGYDHLMLPLISDRAISTSELEIVEELEFYEWLESNGYAG